MCLQHFFFIIIIIILKRSMKLSSQAALAAVKAKFPSLAYARREGCWEIPVPVVLRHLLRRERVCITKAVLEPLLFEGTACSVAVRGCRSVSAIKIQHQSMPVRFAPFTDIIASWL